MTGRTAPPPGICSNCRGFASVAITVGGRDRHRNLRTITAHCSVCHGLGTIRPPRTREGARA